MLSNASELPSVASSGGTSMGPMMLLASSRDDDSDVLRRLGRGFVLLRDGSSGVSKIGEASRSILDVNKLMGKGHKSLKYSGTQDVKCADMCNLSPLCAVDCLGRWRKTRNVRRHFYSSGRKYLP